MKQILGFLCSLAIMLSAFAGLPLAVTASTVTSGSFVYTAVDTVDIRLMLQMLVYGDTI